METMAKLGLESDGLEHGLGKDPMSGRLAIVKGTTNSTNFGNLIPLGHTHTGNDRTPHPSNADLDEFSKKKVQEHWIRGREGGWARVRYDANSNSFEVIVNEGKNAIRYTRSWNPNINPQNATPWEWAQRWSMGPRVVEGQYEVRPPQPKGPAGSPKGGGTPPARARSSGNGASSSGGQSGPVERPPSKYARAIPIIRGVGKAAEVASVVLLTAEVIVESRNPELREFSLGVGKKVEETTGSKVLGALVAAKVHTEVSLATVAKRTVKEELKSSLVGGIGSLIGWW